MRSVWTKTNACQATRTPFWLAAGCSRVAICATRSSCAKWRGGPDRQPRGRLELWAGFLRLMEYSGVEYLLMHLFRLFAKAWPSLGVGAVNGAVDGLSVSLPISGGTEKCGTRQTCNPKLESAVSNDLKHGDLSASSIGRSLMIYRAGPV